MITKPPKGKLLNRSHWMSRGLVGCWLFNLHPQILGQAFDYANGNHGILGSADVYSVPGKFGNALSFGGTTGHVDLDAHISKFSSLTQGTILFWFKWLNTTGWIMIFSASDKSDLSSDISIIHHGVDNKLCFNVREAGGTLLNAEMPSEYDDDLWHQYAVSVGNSGNKHFIDGAQVTASYPTGDATTQAWFNSVNDLDTLRFANREDSGGDEYHFTGQIDHLMIYDRALLGGEVLSLYRRPFQMFEGSGL